ncbi:MAG: phage tail protein [Kofleriaceae bacterium]|nr:phage tail protein [Kofleriaceae bacterium]MCL4228239.1 phage tail protein [Myxococcales bacterium]
MARKDPFLSFCFRVTIDGVVGDPAVGFFKSVGGLSYETEVVEYREGGDNNSTRKLVGATKWKNITLKRGFGGPELIRWREQWLNPMGGPAMGGRKGGKIEQLSTDGKVVASWTFRSGWPVKWEVSELDATKSEVSIETLEIAHEGLSFGG